MNHALEDMVRPYAPVTPLDWVQATREIVQEIDAQFCGCKGE